MTEQTINKGQSQCPHNYISYLNAGFDGQAWWCDIPECNRHERLGYTPIEKIQFPPNAFIRVSETNHYFWQANEQGIAQKLPKDDRINRDSVKLDSIL
tara:strand:- start:495 stop:788 length:294 start_codon:yes stop_codon:yes gene_type:complete